MAKRLYKARGPGETGDTAEKTSSVNIPDSISPTDKPTRESFRFVNVLEKYLFIVVDHFVMLWR